MRVHSAAYFVLGVCFGLLWRSRHDRPRKQSRSTEDAPGGNCSSAAKDVKALTVGTGQLRPGKTLHETTQTIIDFIEQAATKGARLVAFPEAALPGYSEEQLLSTSAEALNAAIEMVKAACARHRVACILGAPYRDVLTQKNYNSALVINERGALVGHQPKMQLVPGDVSWSVHGDKCRVFSLGGVTFGILICHDKRFPELARLMVLAGARVLFYLSCEQWHDDMPLPFPRDPPWSKERLETEMNVYRAQIQARAVENRVWLVKSNMASSGSDPSDGSHGRSCFVSPTGIVEAEAGTSTEELLIRTLDLDRATACYAQKSLLPEYSFHDWWKQLLQTKVRRISS